MRQIARPVRDLVDRKKNRTWNMTLQVIKPRVSPARQAPGRVDNPQIRRAGMLKRPWRGHKKRKPLVYHRAARNE
jgi:hypothetical protein